MSVKTIHFLSGLPRSGSTLLGSLLAQHEDVYVTPTSPVLDLLCFTNDAFNKLNTHYTYKESIDIDIYKAIVDTYYGQYSEPIIIDKHRGWPRNVWPATTCITPAPKIICTHRPISEVITSYIVLINQQKGDNFVDNHLMQKRIPITTEARAKCLWENYISDPYNSLVHGLSNHRSNILLVSYDEITGASSETMSRIDDFLGLDHCNHDFGNIKNACAEDKDSAWGLAGLHNIRPVLYKSSIKPSAILGPFLSSYYDKFNIGK